MDSTPHSLALCSPSSPGSGKPCAHDLPYDILGEVFKHCLPHDDGVTPAILQPDTTQAPILLCHICSHWRNVALATSQLWNQLHHITVVTLLVAARSTRDLHVYRVRPKDLEFLHWWSKNLKGNSLVLRLYAKSMIYEHWSDKYPIDEHLDFPTALLQAARDVDTDFPILRAAHYAIRGNLFNTSHLQTLAIHQSSNVYGSVFEKLFAHIASSLSDLRKLDIKCLLLRAPLDSPSHVRSIWSQITHLRLTIMLAISKWYEFMGYLTALENAEIFAQIVPDQSAIASAHRNTGISLPNLSQMHIAIGATAPVVFCDLLFPALHTLRVSANKWTTADLNKLLLACRNLKHLRMPIFQYSDIIVNSTAFDTLAGFAPYLETLHFVVAQEFRIYDEYIPQFAKEIVKSEWLNRGPSPMRNPLQLVFLVVEYKWKDEDRSIFREVKESIESLNKYIDKDVAEISVEIQPNPKPDPPLEYWERSSDKSFRFTF